MADTLIREATAYQSNPLSPVPQYWTGTAYEKVQGVNGSARTIIYDAAGVALFAVANAGYIQKIDGADITLGAKADAAIQDASSSGSAIALLKGIQAILGLVTASPTANTVLDRLKTINTTLSAAIPAGTNLIGKFGIDQTTDGTTNRTVSKISQTAGENIIVGAVVGTQANAWSAAAVSAGGDSTAIDCQYQYRISAFGNVDAATTITAWVSQDNTTFYETSTNVVLGGSGSFHISFETAARYVRLRSSGAATITATIAGK